MIACRGQSDGGGAKQEATGTTSSALSAFVQSSYANPVSASVTFSKAQRAGNLNVVAIGGESGAAVASVASVTDTAGNAYVLASQPAQHANQANGNITWETFYYAKNIAASASNTVTVRLSFTAVVDVRVLEYSGLDRSAPLDVAAVQTGQGTTTSASVATTNAKDLIVASNNVENSTSAPGTGFTSRMITPYGDIVEDKVVSSVGSYTATAQTSAGAWVEHVAAFKAGAGSTPAFAQSNYVNLASEQPVPPVASVTFPLPSGQTAGDVNVVAIGWDSSPLAGITSVQDSAGNLYALAVGPAQVSEVSDGYILQQSIYYAKNIVAAAANSLTVTFAQPVFTPDIRVVEYSGIDPNSPVDVTATLTGKSASPSSGAVTTTNASDVLVAASLVEQTTTGAGPGFTSRIVTPFGNILEDKTVSSVGSYSATATASASGPWVSQLVALRASGSLCAGVTCKASDACHVAGTCNPSTGVCSNPAAANGTVCNDGNACTQSDTCQSGTCTGANPVTCAASDQCHAVGACNPATGACSNPTAANGTACSDGNACTQSDTCQSGTCTGGSGVTCTASDQCHAVGACNPATGACSNPVAANGTACSDGNACTQSDTCQSGTCIGGSAVTCTASDQCHSVGACNPATGVCSNPTAANGTACSDGNACTQSDTCQSGTCTGGSGVTCTASDQCHAVGTCNPATGACSNPVAANGTACSDGNACTQSDTCQSGTCTGANPVTCAASDQCHSVGACNPATGACSNPVAANGTACNDGNVCTQSDTCQSGTCTGANPVTCTASDKCHNPGACDPVAGCSNPSAPAGTACGDNSNACVGAFTCDASGTCVQGPPPTIDRSNPCVIGSCDPVKGVVYASAPPGTACGDNSNRCAGAFTCNEQRQCVQGAPPAPTPPNRCYSTSCDPADGFSYTAIAGCDSSALSSDHPFEAHASLIGLVQLPSGTGLSGYTVSVSDLPGGPRTDVSAAVASDGSFRVQLTNFPQTEPLRTPPHHVLVRVDSPNTVSVFRDAYLHAGQALDLGTMVAGLRDSKITNIGPAGGVATDSQALVEVDVPPGALSTSTPIVVTPHATRAEVPFRLPDTTLTTYAVTFEPAGTQFASPVTVRLVNWRNLPTSSPIPVGYVESGDAIWRAAGAATWDGSAFAFGVSHFSTYDINFGAPDLVELISYSSGRDPSQSNHSCGFGSSVGLANGTLRQQFPLPSYQRLGQSYGLTLTYDSLLTASPAAASPPPAGQPAYGAVSQSSAAVTGRNGTVSMTCVPRAEADAAASTTPGTCIGGSCGGGGAVSIPLGSLTQKTSWNGSRASSSFTHSVPAGALDVELKPSGNIPLAPNGALPSPFFSRRHTEITSGSSGSCASAGAGATFGVSGSGSTLIPTNQEMGPLVVMDEDVFVEQTQTSAYGTGWGIAGVSRLYTSTASDLAVLADGNGDRETFSPRPNITSLGLAPAPGQYALAADLTSGQLLMAQPTGEIDTINPSTGGSAAILTGLAFPSGPIAMAVTYVSGVRHFVIALETELVDVTDVNATLRVLTSRTMQQIEHENRPQFWWQPGVAASGDLAFYVSGDVAQPILYRFRLSDAVPVAEAISSSPGGDGSLDPLVPLDQVSFTDPKGLAYIPGQGLYIADRKRDTVFLAAPQKDGEVGIASAVTRVVGSGGAQFIPPLGYRSAGLQFPMNQPYALGATVDGALWISAPFGFAVYDPQTREAKWTFFDGTVANSEVTYALRSIGNAFTAVPLDSTSILAIDTGDIFRIDVSLLSSELDPTRSLLLNPTGATLTDTTADTKSQYDSQGRLQSVMKRTGANVRALTYVAGTDHVATIVDGAGGTTTFGYSGNALQSITDPAGHVTNVSIDPSGDLRSFTKPDGETYAFAYTAHQMMAKTAPTGDVTQYGYASDGSLAQTTKPAQGDNYSLAPAYSQAPQRDPQGNTVHVGTYTDPRGVTHTVTVDHHGQIATDAYVADGQSYVMNYVKLPTVGVDSGDPLTGERKNVQLERVSYVTVNGLVFGLEKIFDGYGRIAGTSQGAVNFLGKFDTLAYDANGRLSVYQPGGTSDRFVVSRDAAGNPTQITEFDINGPTRQKSFTWNGPNGQADTITEHGVTTTISFDSATGNPSHTVDTLGRVTTLGYDPAGNVVAKFDGQTTQTFAYDANNRLTTSTDADNHATTFGYAQSGCGCSQDVQLTSIHTPDLPPNQSWTMTYGPEGRLATLVDPDGRAEAYTYEPTGERHSVTDRLGHATTIGHDQLGRVSSIVDAIGRAHQQSYPIYTSAQLTGAQLLTGSASASPAAADLTAALNAGDYQIGTRDFASYSVDNTNTNFGTRGSPQISYYRDATTQVSYGMQFDSNLRMTRRDDRSGLPFAGDTVLVASDTSGNGLSGKYTQSFYDWSVLLPINRLNFVSAYTRAGNSESSNFSYNSEYDLMNAVGLQNQRNGWVNETYTRDTGGRLTSAFQTYLLNNTSFVRPTDTYAYEPTSDRLAKVVDADGEHDYSYDARGLIQTIAASDGTYTFGYDAMGRNSSLTFPDGHQRIQQYDPEGRMVSRCYQYSGGPSSRCYGATYDAVGNPLTFTDPEGTDTMTYDALNRLTSVKRQVSGSPDVTETYAYNALGALNANAPETTGINLNDARPVVGGSGSSTAPSAIMNAINGAPVTVDPAGRVTGLQGATLTFGKQNILESVQTGSSTEAFYYDANLRRILRNKDGLYEAYVYGGANIVARLDATGNAIDQFFYDGVDSPLRLTRGGSNYYYELDLAGNVRRLRDKSGADLGGYRYTAFGQLETANATTPSPTLDQPLRWKGRWFENVAGGIYDIRARWWSPQLGAFLSIDEFAYHDRNSTLWGWPGQSPARWSDPQGRFGVEVGAGIGAEIGLFFGWGASAQGGLYSGTGGSGVWGGTTISNYVIGASAGAGGILGFYTGDSPTDTENVHVSFWILGASVNFDKNGAFNGIQLQIGPSAGQSLGASPVPCK